jgi:hypothetical protein
VNYGDGLIGPIDSRFHFGQPHLNAYVKTKNRHERLPFVAGILRFLLLIKNYNLAVNYGDNCAISLETHAAASLSMVARVRPIDGRWLITGVGDAGDCDSAKAWSSGGA